MRHCRCPLCLAATTHEADCFPSAATSEALTDTLGFCARHGAQWMARRDLHVVASAVLAGAEAAMLPLLDERRFGDERFQSVFFNAGRACPACAHEHRFIGRKAARLGRDVAMADDGVDTDALSSLCIPHFRTVARGLRPAPRMLALAAYAQILESVDGLATAFEMAASTFAQGIPRPRSALDDSHEMHADLENAIASQDVCAVCLEIERTRRRCLYAIPRAVELGLDRWLFLPTCPEHILEAVAPADAAVAGPVCQHALQVAGEHLHQQLRVLVQAAESRAELEAARVARWGRRPRRKKSDPPRPPAPRLARCVVCERVAISEIQATGHLLRLLRTERHRKAFTSGFGLCTKHHAHAYLMSAKGATRSFLAADQQRRLLRSIERLSGGTMEDDWRRLCGFG